MKHSMLWPDMEKFIIVSTSVTYLFLMLYSAVLQPFTNVTWIIYRDAWILAKKNLLCSFIDVIPGRFRSLQKKNMQSMHPKQYIAERGQSCCIGMHPKSKGNTCKWFCHTLLIFKVELVFPIVSKIKMVWW